MHDFTELKNQLCKELDKISAKGELNTQSLDYADKAAHALKCILTVEAMMEEYPSYSGTNGSYRMPGMSYNGNGYISTESNSVTSKAVIRFTTQSKNPSLIFVKNITTITRDRSVQQYRIV